MPVINCLVCQNPRYVKLSHIKKGWGKFCSKECQYKSQMTGKSLLCHECGKEIYKSKISLSRSKSRNYFCSKSCQTMWRNKVFSGELSTNWIDGENAYRDILGRSEAKKECFLCKIDDFRVLCVHHIDHNRKNNNVENLTWLCMNCHYLVHHSSEIDKKMRK